MENTHISWSHNTWNPWVGCDMVAPECAHCYIGRVIRKQTDHVTGEKREAWGRLYRTAPASWASPIRWERRLNGQVKRVFTCSLSDFFHADADPWRGEAWDVIRSTPHLVYLILTKRPALVASRLPKDWGRGWPNVWLGTSVGCRISLPKMDALREIPVHPKAVRFLSCEPLLEDIAPGVDLDGFGWVIAGGESGTNPEYFWDPKADWRKELNTPGRRTMWAGWGAKLRNLCAEAGVPFWFKQVTASRPGQGEDALGRQHREVPPPHTQKWAETEHEES